jgi:hypothetical protein
MAVSGDRDVLAELEEDGVHGFPAVLDGRRYEHRLQGLEERLSADPLIREEERRLRGMPGKWRLYAVAA